MRDKRTKADLRAELADLAQAEEDAQCDLRFWKRAARAMKRQRDDARSELAGVPND